MAVNLSARQFAQPQLPARVAELLRDAGLPPERLELEITENAAMHDVGRAIATLQQLRAIGVKLSVDDFGTGFSSLSYLKRFPIDKLKVDQSFVRNLPHDDNDAAITRAVIALGNSLRLKVIAEGVETAEQLAWLRASGCHEYQGFYYSRPLPPEEFRVRVTRPRAGVPGAGPGRPASGYCSGLPRIPTGRIACRGNPAGTRLVRRAAQVGGMTRFTVPDQWVIERDAQRARSANAAHRSPEQ
ncbi:MAG: EAL domain-containing protein [Chromatiales bacterium]|nr:EAL domain-containing protein [Chromatiales bacterium]